MKLVSIENFQKEHSTAKNIGQKRIWGWRVKKM